MIGVFGSATTGSGCAVATSGFGKSWEFTGIGPNDALTPTTTVGMIINYASSTFLGINFSTAAPDIDFFVNIGQRLQRNPWLGQPVLHCRRTAAQMGLIMIASMS